MTDELTWLRGLERELKQDDPPVGRHRVLKTVNHRIIEVLQVATKQQCATIRHAGQCVLNGGHDGEHKFTVDDFKEEGACQ